MSEIKVLPCPFCGGETQVYDDECGHYAIGCKFCCDVAPATTWEDTVEKAIAIWNTRKPMQEIVEKLEEINYNDIQMVVSEVLEKYGFPKESVVQDEIWDELDGLCTSKYAIEIVKEVGGMNE